MEELCTFFAIMMCILKCSLKAYYYFLNGPIKERNHFIALDEGCHPLLRVGFIQRADILYLVLLAMAMLKVCFIAWDISSICSPPLPSGFTLHGFSYS